MLHPAPLFLIVTASTASPLVACAQTNDPTETLCRTEQTAELELWPDEFVFDGYDAEVGVAALLTRSVLAEGHGRRRPVRFARALHDRLLIPMAPDVLTEAIDAHRSGALRLVLRVHRTRREDGGPDSPPCADGVVDVTPTAARLRPSAAPFPIAERRLDRPLPAVRITRPDVRVGRIKRDPESPSFDPAPLPALLKPIGLRCLRQSLVSLPSLQGALTVELRRSPIGRPVRPRVVVDGLVSRPVNTCLVAGLMDERAIWRVLTPGASAYVTFYFRGVPVELPGPAASLTDGAATPR